METSKKKIILFANWGLGARVLTNLLKENYKISAVVTQIDKDSKDEYFNLVYKIASANNIPLFSTPEEVIDGLLDDSIGVSISFNKIFSKKVLEKLPIINFHPAVLPDYRGASPIEWQIKSGERSWGGCGHWVIEEIDAGELISHGSHPTDDSVSFVENLNLFNVWFSDFIVKTIANIVNDGYSNIGQRPTKIKGKYYPRIRIPNAIRTQNLQSIGSFLKRKRIAVFTGNRAEFGILLPLLIELQREFYIDLFVSGAHLIPPWNTIKEIQDKIAQYMLAVNIIAFPLHTTSDYYADTFTQLFPAVKKHFTKSEKFYGYDLSICLGDRIETFAFANASFFSKIPVAHFYGGDVANVPYFDTSIRHAITKISHLHFTASEASKKVVVQLGEEQWRIKNVGNLTFDYDRLNLIPSRDELIKLYNLKIGLGDFLIIATWHPSQFKTKEDNLWEFNIFLRAIGSLSNSQVILTYPNNDPGGELVVEKIKELQTESNLKIKVIPNVGTLNLMGLMKHFKAIVAGNSSGGIGETPYFNTPALNIGDRQTERGRGANVFDSEIVELEIKELLQKVTSEYDSLREEWEKGRYIFGRGNAAELVNKYLKDYLSLTTIQLVVKKFILNHE
jgi:UDP-hydrolysing UDP-N-acetyl-D-glucosamine 2-epimerase